MRLKKFNSSRIGRVADRTNRVWTIKTLVRNHPLQRPFN
jgi:hypothetical protein